MPRLTYFSDRLAARSNHFDLLRLVLAVAVIFTHSYLLAGSAGEPFLALSHGQAAASAMAVTFFFAISGFLITGSWLRTSRWQSYLRNRALRIYPGLIVALAFSYVLVAPLVSGQGFAYWSHRENYGFLGVPFLLPFPIHDAAFVANPHPQVNGSLWTIPCEMLMYLLIMVLGWGGVFRRRALVLLGFLLTFALYRGLGRFGVSVQSPIPYFGNVQVLLFFLTYFLAGMTLALFADRVPHSAWLVLLSLLALLACRHHGLNAVLPFAGVYLLFYAAFLAPNGRPFIHRWGDFSYGTYLYAYPIQQLIVLGFPRLGALPLFAVSVPVTLLVGALSWRWIESPFLRKKTRAQVEPNQPEPILPEGSFTEMKGAIAHVR